MFEFKDPDTMSRIEMLAKAVNTKSYWTSMFHLKGAFLSWGDQTSDLIRQYEIEGQDNKLIDSFHDAAVRGEITVKKLTNLLEKLDAYARDLDARLADGTKLFTVQDIINMTEEKEGKE